MYIFHYFMCYRAKCYYVHQWNLRACKEQADKFMTERLVIKAKEIDAPIQKKSMLPFYLSGNTILSQNARNLKKRYWKRTANCLLSFSLLLKLEGVMCRSSSNMALNESLFHYQLYYSDNKADLLPCLKDVIKFPTTEPIS